MTAEENLERLGIVLPQAPAAVANYVAWVRTGNLVITSGQLPWEGSVMKYTGRLGAELSTEEDYQAARLGDHQRHRAINNDGLRWIYNARVRK